MRIQDKACACDPLAKHWASLLQGQKNQKQGQTLCELLQNQNMENLAMQLIGSGNKYELKGLDVNSGLYSTIPGVPEVLKAITTPTLGVINAVGMAPDNTLAYAAFKIPAGEDIWYFGSIDFTVPTVHILARLPSKNYMSGAFDNVGNFWLIANNDGPGGTLTPTVEKVRTPEMFQPVPSPYSTAPNAIGEEDKHFGWSAAGVADLVVLKRDFGLGLKTYIIAGGGGGPIFYDVDAGVTDVLSSNMNDVLGNNTNGFGAAWIFGQPPNEKVYLAANSGAGVIQVLLETVNLNAKTVQVERVGASEVTQANDGLNCMFEESPFEEEATPAPSPLPAPVPSPQPGPTGGPGCELFCLDNGCPCLQPESVRCGLKSCENCTYCS
jgi:hypothetical protein